MIYFVRYLQPRDCCNTFRAVRVKESISLAICSVISLNVILLFNLQDFFIIKTESALIIVPDIVKEFTHG